MRASRFCAGASKKAFGIPNTRSGRVLRERIFPKPVIGACAANARFVPHLTSSCTVERKAVFPRPDLRGSRGEGVRRALSTRCCMMHGCLVSCASRKPSTTDQVLNGVYGSGNRGEMGLFQKRGFIEHPGYKNIDKFEHDFHSQSQRLAPVYRAD